MSYVSTLGEIRQYGRPRGGEAIASARARDLARWGLVKRTGKMRSRNQPTKKVAAYVVTSLGERVLADEPSRELEAT